MEQSSYVKIAFLALLFSSLMRETFESQGHEVYTIDEAQQCFHSQALPACEQTINQCLMKRQCEKQLHFYHDCNFEKEFQGQVFNGNCFKNWKNTAMASKQVINCIDDTCNLAGYNSEVSMKVLYTCTSEALVDFNIQCKDQCQQILKEKISKRIVFEPISTVYGSLKQQDMKGNEEVQKLVEVMRKECIDENGSIKKRQEEDLLKKKKSKQRMVDRINQKNQDEAYLKQYEQKNDSKPIPEDL